MELASGTGAHMEVFAEAYPNVSWQPSEYDRTKLADLPETLKHLPNVLPPVFIDASQDVAEWGIAPASANLVIASNVTHISPWPVTQGLLAGASALLPPGGTLLLYGPFKLNNACTTESNATFDASLRKQNPAWGYRDVAEVQEEALKHSLLLLNRYDMPANNFLLRFSREEKA